MRRSIVAMTGAILAASVALPVAATPPGEGGGALEPDGHKVTICHRTSSSNPAQYWELITVDISSAGGIRTVANHLHHTADVNNRGRSDAIPAYTYVGDPGDPTDDYAFGGVNTEQHGLPAECGGGGSSSPES